MLTSPPQIDRFGNIQVHPLDDIVLVIRGGVGVGSLAGKNYQFELTDGTFKVTLVANPADATQKLLKIPAATHKKFSDGAQFALIDRTDGSRVLWGGTFSRLK